MKEIFNQKFSNLLKKSFSVLSLFGCAGTIIFVFFTPSCEATSPVEELVPISISTKRQDLNEKPQSANAPNFSLNRIDLFLNIGTGVTGTLTVEVRDVTGKNVLLSKVFPAGALATGNSWKTIEFSSALNVFRNESYQIYVTRSDAHDFRASNYIFWACSSSSTPNPYPEGTNDLFPNWNIDYAFRTFNRHRVAQRQELNNYGFFIGNTFGRWQTFKID